MFKINLQFNKDIKWSKSKNAYSKGYLFDNKEILCKDKKINLYFKNITEKNFANKLVSANGNFAIVVFSENKLFAAVDRLRSIPLFYALRDNKFYISDNAHWIREQIGLKNLDDISEQEFLLTGYVTGKDTLFTETKQVQAGEYLVIKEESSKITIKTIRYYRFLHKKFFTESKEELYKKLDSVYDNLINRLIKSVNGRTILVPLSGGYDSRSIVSMLKKLNYENVICFSYGRKGHWESEISKKISRKLGYKWYFIEYNKKKWRDWFNSREMKQYLKYGNNLTSLAHIQDWPAVWELKKNKIIPNDVVFVPGHSGDLLGGSWTPKPLDIYKTNYNLNDISCYLFKRHYCLFDLKDTNKKDLFLEKIKNGLNDLKISDVESFVSLSDYWNITNRQAKFIVNSVRVYEFFGYEWRIPLWDSELMDFWSKIPLKFRINKDLYDDYLFERLFSTFNIVYKKDNNRNIKYIIKKIIKNNNLLFKIGIFINTYFFDYFTHHLSWYDIVNYYKYLHIMPLGGNIYSLLTKISLELLRSTLREKKVKN